MTPPTYHAANLEWRLRATLTPSAGPPDKHPQEVQSVETRHRPIFRSRSKRTRRCSYLVTPNPSMNSKASSAMRSVAWEAVSELDSYLVN
jgi:hypothetical protein